MLDTPQTRVKVLSLNKWYILSIHIYTVLQVSEIWRYLKMGLLFHLAVKLPGIDIIPR